MIKTKFKECWKMTKKHIGIQEVFTQKTIPAALDKKLVCDVLA